MSTETQRASHVYILAHREAPRFKIGKADDVFGRMRTIGLTADSYDFTRSIGLRVASPAAALKLESLLHRLFSAYRIDAFEVTKDSGDCAGSTEWFHSNCLARLRTFIDSNQDLLGFEEVNVDPSERRQNSMASPARRRGRADPWITQNVALLGFMPDTELAQRLGVSTDAVYRERQRRGIPPFAPPGGPKKEGSTARTIRLSNVAWAAYEVIGERKGLEPLLIKAAAKVKKTRDEPLLPKSGDEDQ